MRRLAYASVLAMCLTGLLWAEGKQASPKAAGDGKKGAVSHEKSARRLEASLRRNKKMSESVEKIAAGLRDPDAQRKAKELRELCSARENELSTLIEKAKQGQNVRMAERNAAAAKGRKVFFGLHMLHVYFQKEKAQDIANTEGVASNVKADAVRVVEICDKLIENLVEIEKLQAQRDALEAEMETARAKIARQTSARAKPAKGERKKAARKSRKKQPKADEDAE